MREFVLIAEFEVKEGAPEILINAGLREGAAVLHDEPGCRVFDIVVSGDGDHKGLFYEVFDDEVAREKHRESPHLVEFRSAIEALTIEWEVTYFWRVTQ